MAREIDSLLMDPKSLPRAVMINLLLQEVRVVLATVSRLDTHYKAAEEAYKVINMMKDRLTVNEVKRACTECACQPPPRRAE